MEIKDQKDVHDYKDCKELERVISDENDINDLCKKHKWKWYEWPEIWFRRYIQRPWEDAISYIKRFIQRGIRGYGDSDLWNMNYFLTEIILNMLVELKRIKHGVPSILDEATGNYDYDEQKWNEILDKMIEGFAILRKCDLYDEMIEWGGYLPDESRKQIQDSMQKKYSTWRFTTREEEAKVKLAFELFSKYYQSLWD
jgi:hypothetical protein